MIPPDTIAHIIQAEAAGCGLQALLVSAWVLSRNPTMYGWADEYTDDAYWVAVFWSLYQDPTEGAQFLFSLQDLADPRVQAIIEGRGPPTWSVDCGEGYGLVAYR